MKRLLVLVVLLAACGGPADDVAAPSAPATGDQQTASGGDTAVPAALNWSVERLGGGQIEGGDLAGRDVVLWFWAPW